MPASHSVETTPEGKVRIRDLELFMGFDPAIDSDEDEAMAQYDNRRVKDIVQRTGKFIQRGSRPKLVIEHEKDGKPTRPEAVGDITGVRYEERNGVGYVVGDVEMPKEAFDSLLASNAYPRRSAEIWKDNHLSEVALLGRDTPRRPLPDTRFTKRGDKVTFERPMGTLRISIDPKVSFAEIGVGGGPNVYVPSTATGNKNMPSKKKRMEAEDESKKALAAAMECEAEDEVKDEQEADAEAMAAGDEAEEMAGAGMEYEDKFEDGVHVDIGSHQGEAEEEDEDEEEMEAAYGGKTKMSKNSTKAEKALFARVQALETSNKTLQRQLRLERFGREVDGMLASGYRCGKFRNQMVEELADSKQPEAKMAFWKATMAKDPIGIAPIAVHAVTDEGSPALDMKAATARAVAESNGDIAKFKTLFAKYSGQKAV
jgi:hypothetical protein